MEPVSVERDSLVLIVLFLRAPTTVCLGVNVSITPVFALLDGPTSIAQ
jgi:hypothetical protein